MKVYWPLGKLSSVADSSVDQWGQVDGCFGFRDPPWLWPISQFYSECGSSGFLKLGTFEYHRLPIFIRSLQNSEVLLSVDFTPICYWFWCIWSTSTPGINISRFCLQAHHLCLEVGITGTPSAFLVQVAWPEAPKIVVGVSRRSICSWKKEMAAFERT